MSAEPFAESDAAIKQENNEPIEEGKVHDDVDFVEIAPEKYNRSDMFHALDISEIQHRLSLSSIKHGIPHERVDEYATKLGDNRIPMQDGPSIPKMLFHHFCNSITLILGLVAVVSAVFQDWGEFGVVIFVIIFNALLGFYQEYSAEKSLQGLKDMTAGVAKVIRSGHAHIIPLDDLVVGDIVVLEQGASVPADIRLFEVSNLEIDECKITGESLPVIKHTNVIEDDDHSCSLGDRKNCAYRNTVVTQGRGKGIAVLAGNDTEMGKMAKTLTEDSGSNETPLQKKMKYLMWALFGVCGILAVIVFGANSWAFDDTTILYACAVAVAILPESLVAVITVAMTISVNRMAKQKCIVRKLAALEVLGNVTDICSDKTGTLTENKMVTNRIVLGVNHQIEVVGSPMGAHGSFVQNDEYYNVVGVPGLTERFFKSCALCSSTHLTRSKEDHEVLEGTGNPTEIAIQVMTWKAQANRERFEQKGWEKVGEFPFDSTIKRMSVAYINKNDDSLYLCAKGAPERVLELCTHFLKEEDDELHDLTEHDKDMVNYQIQQLAALGLRTICLAERRMEGSEFDRETDFAKLDRDSLEKGLIYLGIVGIYDPPRPESKPSVQICQHAGIKVRMLTGDHTSTACAIATKLNIVNEHTGKIETNVIAGPDFDKLTDEQEDALGDLPAVVGRCSPESKVKMIQALHRRGRIAAMTGDGFNDSPSIKKADIGCAMGSGTDVTKGVADIVITDDNFATIVKAVAEGRRISSAIKKFVVHLLSGNVAEVIVLVCGLGIMHEGRSVFVLSPIEILWLNMFTGSPPATGLSLDEADPDILHVPPNTSGFFTKELNLDTLLYGTFLGICALMSFIYVVYGYHGGLTDSDDTSGCNKPDGTDCDIIWTARATAFSVLYLGLLIHAYNVRNTRKSVFQIKWFDNNWLWGSVAFGVVTLVPMLYVEPIAKHVFVHKMLTWEWIVVLIALIIFMILCEIYKQVKNIVDPMTKIAVPKGEEEADLNFSMEMGTVDNRSAVEAGQENLRASFATMNQHVGDV